MSLSIIPLTRSPNQSLSFKLTVNGKNIHLRLFLRYLEEYGHWIMNVTDVSSGTPLLAGVPLVPGNGLSANILAPYAYLDIGEAYLAKKGEPDSQYPDSETLGDSWVLMWGTYE